MGHQRHQSWPEITAKSLFPIIGEAQHETIQDQKLKPQIAQMTQMGADPPIKRDPGAPTVAHACEATSPEKSTNAHFQSV